MVNAKAVQFDGTAFALSNLALRSLAIVAEYARISASLVRKLLGNAPSGRQGFESL